ncbi:hypothetical protein CesoFtcFv8_007761 [Champsocephalus esox]|uniref:Uncharacterized protein n=1 Tax=Champsocephalus esox TaxID=159716 RepID=A0AAN8CF10_9TELE|nr:hypothetical protein CesoFtcFv8_007761 [Champsocephalus esox]
MEMSLVMHLPLSLVPDSPSHPCIAHVCRLLLILHPSPSHPTFNLSFPPSLLLRQRQKPRHTTLKLLFKPDDAPLLFVSYALPLESP